MEAPELFMGGYYKGEYSPEKRVSEQKPGGDHFTVDDLFDFPNDDDDAMMTDDILDSTTATATNDDSATFNSNESCNSSASGNFGYQSLADSHFSGELCVPYDDMAQLEWLSNFVEDSFSTKQNLQSNFHMIPVSKPLKSESSSSITDPNNMTQSQDNAMFHCDAPLPGKARSKRSRAPCDWSKRILHMAPMTKPQSKKQNNFEPSQDSEGTGRKCLHCATDKTPQWRTGPMGPKTLCNACGVRYKSGRLVPEYRPAASPTFVATKHSNSHRKVIEIRRQKDIHRAHDQQQFFNQNSVFGEDFLIHQHNNPNFRHMI